MYIESDTLNIIFDHDSTKANVWYKSQINSLNSHLQMIAFSQKSHFCWQSLAAA